MMDSVSPSVIQSGNGDLGHHQYSSHHRDYTIHYKPDQGYQQARNYAENFGLRDVRLLKGIEELNGHAECVNLKMAPTKVGPQKGMSTASAFLNLTGKKRKNSSLKRCPSPFRGADRTNYFKSALPFNGMTSKVLKLTNGSAKIQKLYRCGFCHSFTTARLNFAQNHYKWCKAFKKIGCDSSNVIQNLAQYRVDCSALPIHTFTIQRSVHRSKRSTLKGSRRPLKLPVKSQLRLAANKLNHSPQMSINLGVKSYPKNYHLSSIQASLGANTEGDVAKNGCDTTPVTGVRNKRKNYTIIHNLPTADSQEITVPEERSSCLIPDKNGHIDSPSPPFPLDAKDLMMFMMLSPQAAVASMLAAPKTSQFDGLDLTAPKSRQQPRHTIESYPSTMKQTPASEPRPIFPFPLPSYPRPTPFYPNLKDLTPGGCNNDFAPGEHLTNIPNAGHPGQENYYRKLMEFYCLRNYWLTAGNRRTPFNDHPPPPIKSSFTPYSEFSRALATTPSLELPLYSSPLPTDHNFPTDCPSPYESIGSPTRTKFLNVSTKGGRRCQGGGLGKHLCTECGKRFNTSYHLKRHSYVHTGLKPYNCRVCAKAFAERSHFVNHTCRVKNGAAHHNSIGGAVGSVALKGAKAPRYGDSVPYPYGCIAGNNNAEWDAAGLSVEHGLPYYTSSSASVSEISHSNSPIDYSMTDSSKVRPAHNFTPKSQSPVNGESYYENRETAILSNGQRAIIGAVRNNVLLETILSRDNFKAAYAPHQGAGGDWSQPGQLQNNGDHLDYAPQPTAVSSPFSTLMRSHPAWVNNYLSLVPSESNDFSKRSSTFGSSFCTSQCCSLPSNAPHRSEYNYHAGFKPLSDSYPPIQSYPASNPLITQTSVATAQKSWNHQGATKAVFANRADMTIKHRTPASSQLSSSTGSLIPTALTTSAATTVTTKTGRVINHTGAHKKIRMKKLHPCDACGKEFRDSYHLKRHYYLHTGKKPFTCPRCGKSYAEQSHLRIHKCKFSGAPPSLEPCFEQEQQLQPTVPKEPIAVKYELE